MRPSPKGATTKQNQFVDGLERPHRVQKRKKKLVGFVWRKKLKKGEEKRDALKKKSDNIGKKK